MKRHLLQIRGLRKRWLINSIGPVIVILALVAVLGALGLTSVYYTSALSSLEAKAKAGAESVERNSFVVYFNFQKGAYVNGNPAYKSI